MKEKLQKVNFEDQLIQRITYSRVYHQMLNMWNLLMKMIRTWFSLTCIDLPFTLWVNTRCVSFYGLKWIDLVKELLSQLVYIKNSAHDAIIIKLITEAIQSLVLYRELRKIIKNNSETTNYKSNTSQNSIDSSEKLLDLKWRHTFLQWINKVMKILSPKIKEFQNIQRLCLQIKHVEEISSPKSLSIKTKSRMGSNLFSAKRINWKRSKLLMFNLYFII